MALTTFILQLISVTELTSDVKHFAFKRQDGEPLVSIPGQFINLYFPDTEKRQQRSYSISTIPGKTTDIEIAVSYIKGGIASEALWNLQVGDTLEASGPVGRLILKPEEKPQRFILVGTGTGISPYRAMIPSLQQRLTEDENLSVEILFGARSHADLFYAEDFLDLVKHSNRVHFHACYSRKWPEALASWERTCRVTTQLLELNLNPAQDIVYLCGNPSMIDDAFTLLQEKGFDHKNVRREKYVFSHR